MKLLFILLSLILPLMATEKILLCWSSPDHPVGTHDYEGFAQFYAETLREKAGYETATQEGFPLAAQWGEYDLIILNLTYNNMTEQDQASLEAFLKAGKSLMVLHQGLTQRVTYDAWAETLGYAYNFSQGVEKSRWGSGELSLEIENTHPIFKEAPETLTLKEELYWNLKKGSIGEITVLGTCNAPKNAEQFPVNPAFWTTVHQKGEENEARIFCSVLGHYNEFTTGEFFQKMMEKAVKWCLGGKADG